MFFLQGYVVVTFMNRKGNANYIVYVLSRFSHAWLCATLWTVAHQTLLSMGFSRQEYWSGLSFLSPGDLPDPGIELKSPAPQPMGWSFLTHCLLGEPGIPCTGHSFDWRPFSSTGTTQPPQNARSRLLTDLSSHSWLYLQDREPDLEWVPHWPRVVPRQKGTAPQDSSELRLSVHHWTSHFGSNKHLFGKEELFSQ